MSFLYCTCEKNNSCAEDNMKTEETWESDCWKKYRPQKKSLKWNKQQYINTV
jgi:hypothetical protein